MMRHIGDVLRARRIELGMGRAKLAKLAHVGEAVLVRLEKRGEVPATAFAFERICGVLGLTLGDP